MQVCPFQSRTPVPPHGAQLLTQGLCPGRPPITAKSGGNRSLLRGINHESCCLLSSLPAFPDVVSCHTPGLVETGQLYYRFACLTTQVFQFVDNLNVALYNTAIRHTQYHLPLSPTPWLLHTGLNVHFLLVHCADRSTQGARARAAGQGVPSVQRGRYQSLCRLRWRSHPGLGATGWGNTCQANEYVEIDSMPAVIRIYI